VNAKEALGPLLMLSLTEHGAERRLVLATRKGNPIENLIEDEPTEFSQRKWRAIRSKHSRWIERKPDTGIYNCAGIV